MSQRSARFPTRPVAQLLGSNGPVHALAYSASPGTYILAGSSDRSIRLYNPSSTTTINPSNTNTVTAPTPSTPHQPPQIPTGRLIQTYTSHAYEVLSLAVSSDNARFASAGGDRAVLLWDVATAQTLRRLGSSSTAHSHAGRVNAVCFAGSTPGSSTSTTDGGGGGGGESLVISAGLDGTVRAWDIRSPSATRPVQILSEARDAVTCLAVPSPTASHSAGAEIVAGSVDGRVRTYDVRLGRCVADTFPASVTSLCLARDGRTMLVGTLDSKLRLMDRADGACLRTYAHEGWRNEELRVQSVLGGGERFVVAGDEMTTAATDGSSGGGGGGAGRDGGSNNEGRVWAWDLLTGKLVATVPVPWGNGSEKRRKVIGRDGKEKERKNVVSCLAWKDGGFGNQFCVGGTSGVVTVFGEA